jgi:hypothetical protein
MRPSAVVVALLAVAACDEDDPVRHLDGGVDSAVMIDAAAAKPVTLTVTNNGAPTAGVMVHFQDQDSMLIATVMTDAQGKASQLMPNGGYVTAIDAYAAPTATTSHRLTTFAGVKPGDQLVVGDSAFSTASMTVTLPVETDPNIVRYEVQTPCGTGYANSAGSGNVPTTSLNLSRCGANTDFLIIPFDNNNNAISFIYEPNVAVTNQGSLDLTGKSYTATTNRMYTFMNKPAGLATLFVTQYVGSAKGLLFTQTNPTTGVPAIGTVMLPAIANGVSIVEGRAFSQTGSTHLSIDWAPLATTAYTTDFGARMLVDITGPLYEASTHKLLWTIGASGVAADYAEVEVRGTRTVAAQDDRFVQWQMIAPYMPDGVYYPTLPTSTYDYNWDADDSFDISLLTLGKVPGGYDTVRAKVFTVEGPFDLVTTSTGSAQFLNYASNIQSRTQPSVRKVLGNRSQSTR